MAKAKRRTNSNNYNNNDTSKTHQSNTTAMRSRSSEESHSSPFQPLNMFFGRSRNNRYAAIPQLPSAPAPTPSTPSPTDPVAANAPYFNDLSHNRPHQLYDNNILIDMHDEDEADLLRRYRHSSTTTTPNTDTSAHTRIGTPPHLYGSDVDTAGSRRASIEEDVCFPDEKRGETGIDFDELEAYLEEERRTLNNNNNNHHHHPPARKRRLSNMVTDPGSRRFGSFYGDRLKHLNQDGTDAYRFTYYSPAEPSTIHARSISEIPSNGENLSSMLRKGCFWIDVLSPTDAEMKALSKIFHIHPLTAEDITMEEPREKCEVFKNYYFICFRTFDQDQTSVSYLQPVGMYILIMKECILTFHFRPLPHPYHVRKRIKQLKDYINVTPDWICYAILDDITDSFAPLIRAIEFEVDSIDELVLILKESEQSDMLRRIGYCRKRMMGLLRLLVSKADVVKTIVKRGEARAQDGDRPALSNEVALYLGDVQDHIITMLQSLNHYEKISSRSHSNYLAQISIEMTQTNNEINDVLSKLTALGSVLIPMNLVTGLWGMNVQVPGQYQEDLTWFTCIMTSILTFCILSTLLMRYYNIV